MCIFVHSVAYLRFIFRAFVDVIYLFDKSFIAICFRNAENRKEIIELKNEVTKKDDIIYK